MDEKSCISVAIIGSGYMAQEHAKAFQDIPEVWCKGVFSRTIDHTHTFAKDRNIPEVAKSIDELYEKTKADLVIIAVPELAINAVTDEVFKYPWTVFMEKPPGYNLSDAEAIFHKAKVAKAEVYVALNRRFLSSTRFLLNQIIDNGPLFIHIQDQQSQKIACEIGHPEKVVQNWMYANSIHLIDYLTFLNPSKITTVTSVKRWHSEGENSVVVAYIEYADGSCGLYECIWNGPGPWAVTVTTPAQRIELRPLEQAKIQFAGQRTMEFIDPSPWDTLFKPGIRLQAEEMIKIVRGQPGSVPTLNDALITMKLINQIYGV